MDLWNLKNVRNVFVIVIALIFANSSLLAQNKTLDLYLLIGQSNMAGRADITNAVSDTLEGVFLFTNDSLDPWEAAANPFNKYSTIRKNLKMQKMGPGYSFAKEMRSSNPEREVGLIVNAKGGTSILLWMPGTHFFQEAVKRTREAKKYGDLKGILWLQGSSDSKRVDHYLDSLKVMVSTLREELDQPSLPFIACELSEDKKHKVHFNRMLAQVGEQIPYSSVVLAKGTSTIDSTHYDTRSQVLLGQRFATRLRDIQEKTNLEKPNILWLTSEDNNISWIGCYGNKHAETPNIDALAEEGFRYSHCFANAPVCAPERSTWITGLHALSMGTHPMRSRNEIPHELIAYYPDYLKEAGYFVSNGHKTDYNIGGRLDDDCWDNMDNSDSKGREIDWDALKASKSFFKVVNFMESHESRAQGDVKNTKHDPMNTTLHNYHPDLPAIRQNYAKYHDAVKRMDAQIGEVLEQLEEAGLADNTIVVYCSDHGGVLPRSKRFIFASGIHAPMIIRVPEKYRDLFPGMKPGETVDELVSFVDMPKTWLSLAGAEVPDYMQGRIFLGDEREAERGYHFAFRGRMDERIDNARAVYSKDYVYIKNYMPYVPWMQHLNFLWEMEATQAWAEAAGEGDLGEDKTRYFLPKGNSEELYDLNNDWDNCNNLIDDPAYAVKADSMRNALEVWQREIYDSGLLPESEIGKLAKEHGLTIYELVRDAELYDVPELQEISNLALAQDASNLDELRLGLKNEDLGIRYWSMVGCFLLEDKAAGSIGLNDASHEVRALAAWTLIKAGKKRKGCRALSALLEMDSYASLSVMNIIDFLGEDGVKLIEKVDKMSLSPDDQKYELRMQKYLREKYN